LAVSLYFGEVVIRDVCLSVFVPHRGVVGCSKTDEKRYEGNDGSHQEDAAADVGVFTLLVAPFDTCLR